MMDTGDRTTPVLGGALAARSEHYAFIIDRSPAGREMLERLRSGSGDNAVLRERAEGPGIRVWEESGYEFVVIWGTFGYSGGLTIPTRDLSSLLQKVIPTVMEKTREKGGECEFFVAVDPACAPGIEKVLAVFQSMRGTA